MADGKLHIGFDAKRLFFNSSGLGNYSRTLVENLLNFTEVSSNHPAELYLFSPKSPDFKFGNHYADIGNLMIANQLHVFTPKSINPLWRTWGMGSAAQKNKIDVFHGLSNELPLDLPKSIASIVTIHDVLFKEFPKQYSWLDRQIYHRKTAYAVDRADKIIVTSQATANQLQRYYPVPSAKLEVIYQSVGRDFLAIDETQTNMDRSDLIARIMDRAPYIVYHSTFNYRKNHINLLRAFNQIKDQLKFNLVLPGFSGRSWAKVKSYIEEKDLTDRVFTVGAIPTPALIDVLKHAKGFIYPSFNEGFGIPLAEAAALKLPFMVSDIPVFRELLGGKGEEFLFNPSEVSSIAKALLTLEKWQNEPEAMRKWATLHLVVLEKTHPEKVANRLMNLYKS